jgi:archaemetzincin
MKEVLFILMAFKGEVDPKYLQKELEQFYHVKCKVVVEKEINSIAWDKRTHRYSAREILDYQLNYYEDQPSIAITSKDVAVNKFRKDGGSDWGVGGLSIVGQEVSIVSLNRLKSKKLVVKVMLHEFGHGQGLPHCRSKFPCFMKDAKGKLSNISKQPKALCVICTKLLKSYQNENTYSNSSIFSHFFRSIFNI